MAYPGKILAAITAGTYQFRIGPTYNITEEYSAFGSRWPFLVFIGPSGNVARLPNPNRMENFEYKTSPVERPNLSPSGWRGSALVGSNCIEWIGKEMLFVVDRQAWSYNEVYVFAPGGLTDRLVQPADSPPLTMTMPRTDVRNGLGKSFFNGKLIGTVVQDGTYYKKIQSNRWEDRGLTTLLTVCDRTQFARTSMGVGDNASMFDYRQAYRPNTQLRFFSSDWCTRFYGGSTSTSGYLSVVEGFDLPWNHDAIFIGSFNDATNYGGNHLWQLDAQNLYNQFADYLQTQTIYHGGLLYVIKECAVGATRPGNVCGFGFTPLLMEGSQDIPIDFTIYDRSENHYINHEPTPYAQAPFDAQYKCPVVDGNKLYLLQPDGRFLQVVNGEVIQIVNIKSQLQLTSNYASGVYGGVLRSCGHYEEEDGSDSIWLGINTTYKCYGVKLGNTFHAFLNYQLENGRGGVMWATSTDMLNFTDQTSQLPASGIIAPSGFTQGEYLTKISPYQFSGYENFSTIYPQAATSGVPSGVVGKAIQTQPSGWIQASGIHGIWNGSGTFTGAYPADRTQWEIPMYYDAKTKFLFPTWTKEPIAFAKTGLVPTGVKFEGYRWNGVNNYHVYGVKDQTEEKVHLFFTEDVLNHSGPGDNAIGGNTGKNPPDQVLYYTLDQAGTWTFKNQFKSRRLSWVTPTDMLEPAVLLSSGTIRRPFPYENRTNQVVYQPFTVYDWPYFGKVNITAQYSTDYGDTWSAATPHATLSSGLSNVDTGSFAIDPSGTIGNQYMFAWDYLTDVGNNQFDWVQFRLRATG